MEMGVSSRALAPAWGRVVVMRKKRSQRSDGVLTATLNLAIDPDLKATWKATAREQDVSVSMLTEQALLAYLAHTDSERATPAA